MGLTQATSVSNHRTSGSVCGSIGIIISWALHPQSYLLSFGSSWTRLPGTRALVVPPNRNDTVPVSAEIRADVPSSWPRTDPSRANGSISVRLRNSPVMHRSVPDEYKPVIFKAERDGGLKGRCFEEHGTHGSKGHSQTLQTAPGPSKPWGFEGPAPT